MATEHQPTTVKTIVVEERHIGRCSKDVRLRFMRRVFCIHYIQWTITLSITYWATVSEVSPQFIIQHKWLLMIFVPLFLLVMVIYWMARYQSWSKISQFIMLTLETLTLSSLLALFNGYFDAPLFVRASAVLAMIIFAQGLFTLQPWLDYSALLSCIHIIAMACLSTFWFVYQPHQAFFDHGPSIQWLSPPSDIWNILWTFLVASVGALYFNFGIHHMMDELYPDDYMWACYRQHIEGIYTVLVVMRIKDFICPGRGVNRMNGAVDAVSLMV